MTKNLQLGAALSIVAGAACIGGLAGTATATPIFHEGFGYPTGDLHNNLNNSVSPAGDVWTRAGTVAAANIDVTAGSLTSPAGASSGGKATITNPATASTERLNFPAVNSGTVWYSATLNATVGGAVVNNGAGAYFLGLSSLDDNSDADSGAAPALTNIAARLALRVDPTDSSKLNLALTNTTAQTAGSYSAAQIGQGADVFVIVSYEIVPGTTNDVANLWINPDPATFNPSNAPSLTVTGQADLVDVKSFFLRQTGGLPETVNVDEIRVGTAYADVVPEPASLATLGLLGAGMLTRRRGRHR